MDLGGLAGLLTFENLVILAVAFLIISALFRRRSNNHCNDPWGLDWDSDWGEADEIDWDSDDGGDGGRRD